MYERDNLHMKATRYKDDEIWDQYRQKPNSVVHSINKAQRLFYENEVQFNNSNKANMWKALRHIIGPTCSTTPRFITAESFNDYFAKVGTNLAERLDDTMESL